MNILKYLVLSNLSYQFSQSRSTHNDVIKWEHCAHYCPFMKGIHRSAVMWSFDV